jgi:hypothetical protein
VVAPEIAAQFAPLESQRRHWYAIDVVVPLHVPVDVVSDCPACVVPLTCGNAVFVGAETVAAATTPVAVDVAVAEPPVFAAVTATRSVVPASAATSP